MSAKRIDPRRPYRLTPAGVRRIVIGEAGHGELLDGTLHTRRTAQRKPVRLRQAAESWHMAVVHSERGGLDGAARQAIAAAAILAGPATGVVAVVLGELSEGLALAGADRVVVMANLDAANFQPERELAAVSALMASYRPVHVFLPDTALGGGDLGRRLIAAHGGDGAARVVELDVAHVAVPWSGGGTLARRPLPRIVLLAPGAVDANLPFVGTGEIVAAGADPDLSQVKSHCQDGGLEEVDAAQVALEEADFIVGAGNGVRSVATVEALARALGAAVGASRVAVDDGKLPREKQIGATGKTVTASTYVAVGISGAVQHLQGIKDCRHVIAINRDAGAPIVKRADLTVIGDAEELMQALLTRIEQARAQRELPGDPS
jgi:electron transfer flavoprotein alpha subunit